MESEKSIKENPVDICQNIEVYKCSYNQESQYILNALDELNSRLSKIEGFFDRTPSISQLKTPGPSQHTYK